MSGCNHCEALMINGLFCHETGCPEARRERARHCPECGTRHDDVADAAMCCADEPLADLCAYLDECNQQEEPTP
jgi:hypothetical protein